MTISDESRNKLKIEKLEAEKSEIENLRIEIGNVNKKLEDEIKFKNAFNELVHHGSYEGLDKISPEELEKLGYWGILKVLDKIPEQFTTPTPILLQVAMNYPKLAEFFAENSKNLVLEGNVLKMKRKQIASK